MIEVPTKLVPLKQWYCDQCGGVIEDEQQGVLEWDSIIAEDQYTVTCKNFRIVHDTGFVKCRPESDRTELSDWPLSWGTDADGLVELLAMYDRQKINHVELNEIIRRLHVMYYEEGRKYLTFAQEDGETNIDPYSIGELKQSDLKHLIRKYGNK